ncbi:MAG: glutamate 5-kinase [Lentisphaerae bacterium]|nr:glutamate 5-kinase [Lentisphaerota bacterium]
MKKSLRYRELTADVRRVVVKIGSRVLVTRSGRPDIRRMRALIDDMSALRQDGKELAVITSGAIAAGTEALGMSSRPTALPELQMAAAVGQCRLMSKYSELFLRRNLKVGQVLLTHADFQHKIRLNNARRTLDSLLRHGVVPVINENDVVADEEIKADLALGDNDLLAALVVKMIRADMLIILSTVDGLRAPDARGRTRRVTYVETINRAVMRLVSPHKAGGLSKGGMGSKLRAAQMASKAGCTVVIANGRTDGILSAVMRGEDVGTLILAGAG